MLLLRYSHVSQISHLARAIFPESFRAAAILHDQLTYSTFVSVLGIEDIIDEKWLQATLPVRYGGFGLTSMQSISPPAFVSCWSQSLHVLPERFPELRSQIDSFICDIISPNSPENSLCYQLQQSLDPGQVFTDLLTCTGKLQHRLTDKLMKFQFSTTLERAPMKDAARLRSLQGKGAGAWLDSIPSSQKFALSPGSFRLAAFVRLGLSMPLPHSIKTCECGKPLDSIPTGYHLLTCKTGGGPVWTHNTIVSTWSDRLDQIHLPHKVEPRDRYCSSDARPDIAICSNVFDSNVDLDVSLAHPWCSDIISKAAWQDGAAALRREEKKIEKYQKETRPGGFSPNLIPLVFEHYGRWGTEGEKFLNKISHRSTDEDSKSNTADFKTYWRRLFQ